MRAFNQFFNKDTSGNEAVMRFYAYYFTPFTILFLFLDGSYFTEHYFDARWLVNFLVIGAYFILLQGADRRLRKLMLVFVPLGLVGEVIFSLILGLYEYRLGNIPLYVPFGHGALYACGYLLQKRAWALKYDFEMKRFFFIFFASIFIIAGLFFNDIFSLIFGFLFFYRGLRRKNWNSLYYYVAFYVVVLELVGTYFYVWEWAPLALGFIPTASPPMGAVFFYIGADSMLLRIMRLMEKKNWLVPLNGVRVDEKW